MIQEEKRNVLNEYMRANIAPILIHNIPKEIKEQAVIVMGDCNIEDLNGHYEGIEFLPPLWYQKVKVREQDNLNILIIDKLPEISVEEQMKFYELLKYRKISTFELPKNCVILVENSLKSSSLIHPTLYSLMAHIED